MSTPAPIRTRSALVFLSAVLALAGCAKDDYVRLYHSEPRAPSISVTELETLQKMGAHLVRGPDGRYRGVNFTLYSERAERIELLLFDDPESNVPSRTFLMTRFGDVWSVFVEGVGLGQYYGFRAWGPNWPYVGPTADGPGWTQGTTVGFRADVDAEGNRYNPNKLLQDPYATALHRDHDWSKGSVATGPRRADVTYAASSKSVITEYNDWDPQAPRSYVWGPEEIAYRQRRENPDTPGHRWNELILYEVHLKGLTMDPASGVKHPGTYRGAGEMAPYLKKLGVNAVEFLPLHEKPLDGGYWGYQTLNFFAPELSYAADPRPQSVLNEFKWMVEQFHKHDIEVIVDVVYNHTGEGGLWREKIELGASPDKALDGAIINYDPVEVAGLYSYRGIDNNAYYALGADKRTYWNNTGVGNQTRTNHRPMRRLIMDSLRFYVEELHVDGFRFDLGPILGERDGDYNNWDDPKNTVLQDIVDDPVLLRWNTRVISEPWSAGGWYGVLMSAFPASSVVPGTGWYEWNGRFRDWWRSFLNEDGYYLDREEGPMRNQIRPDANERINFGFLMTGSYDWYQWNGRRPFHSVNFITVHDGFPLYDIFSYDVKRNLCGPLNTICCDEPLSPFCDRDSGENHNRSRDWAQHPPSDAVVSQINEAFTPGCVPNHWDGRDTRPNNCWMVPQSEAYKRQQMRNAFAAMLIAHGTPMLYGGDEWMRTQLGNNNAYSNWADNAFNWFDWGRWQAEPERVRMFEFVRGMIQVRKEHAYAFAPDAYGKGAPFKWKSPANTEEVDWNGRTIMIHYDDPKAGPELVVLINMQGGAQDFTLPPDRTWRRLVDTQAWFDSPGYMGEVSADPRLSQNVTLDAPPVIPGGTYGLPARSIAILRAD